MKKIIGLILAMSVLLSYSIPTYASGGWSAHYEEPIKEKDNKNPIDKDTEYMEIVTLPAEEHYSGSASKVSYAQFKRSKQNDTYLYIENSLNENLVKNKKYDFSFYAKGTFENKGIYAGVGTNENTTSGGMVSLISTKRYSVEDKGNGWKLYKFTNIPYDGSGNHFRVKIVQLCTSVYIDGVTLTENGKTDNLIVDGEFENASYIETNDIGNSPDYAPTSVAVAQRAGHIVLGWRNPKNANLSKVSLYGGDGRGGKAFLLSDEFSTTSEGYIEYDVKGLTEGNYYYFIIRFDFGSLVNGCGKITTTQTYVNGVASEKRPATLMNMSYQGNHPGTAYIDHKDSHSEGGALRVISDKPGWESNNYINLSTPSIAFDDTKEYEVSVWVKGRFGANTTESGKIDYKNILKPEWSNFKSYIVSEPDANGWVNVVYSASGVSSKPLQVLAEHRTDLLIDDIEVWEMSEGERTSQIYKQDFNSLDAEVADVQNVKAEVGRAHAIISWEAPSEAKTVKVFVKDGDNLSLRAEVPAQVSGVEFAWLKNDYIYTYVIKAVDSYNNESGGVEITFTPTPDDFECFEFGLYKNYVYQDGFYGNTDFNATAVLKNNKIEEGQNAQIIAVLRKDGERIAATASAITNIPKTKYNENGTEISTTINVPDVSDGEYEISVYLWDGIEDMTILTPFEIYHEKKEE